jgi:hypothetical protein
MDRDLAAKIHKHLLDADYALKRAEWAGDEITGRDERRAFIELLSDVTIPLHFELLRTLYREHPDLEPPREESQIDSTLRWEEVSRYRLASPRPTSTRRFSSSSNVGGKKWPRWSATPACA